MEPLLYQWHNLYSRERNEDSDEYDRHIIIHEWGHYFEDKLSRADSIGGPHGLSDRLDFRVAFGEGWGNAISAIITDDVFIVTALAPSSPLDGQ